MVDAGEVEHLIAERVGPKRARRSANRSRPRSCATLRECGALRVLFPEIDALYGVPQRAEFHPEIDTGAHMRARARHGRARSRPATIWSAGAHSRTISARR